MECLQTYQGVSIDSLVVGAIEIGHKNAPNRRQCHQEAPKRSLATPMWFLMFLIEFLMWREHPDPLYPFHTTPWRQVLSGGSLVVLVAVHRAPLQVLALSVPPAGWGWLHRVGRSYTEFLMMLKVLESASMSRRRHWKCLALPTATVGHRGAFQRLTHQRRGCGGHGEGAWSLFGVCRVCTRVHSIGGGVARESQN
jgi:hypothetical protein